MSDVDNNLGYERQRYWESPENVKRANGMVERGTGQNEGQVTWDSRQTYSASTSKINTESQVADKKQSLCTIQSYTYDV